MGPQGAKGDAGAVGVQGPKGDPGAPGSAGAQGVAGPKGDTGSQGAKGDTGAAGPAGPQGVTGAQGAAGAAGAQGAAGFGTVTVRTPGVTSGVPARALGATFQPHANKAVLVSYAIKTQVTNPLLVGTSTAAVSLLSDSANPPTTERGRVEASSGVGITVTLALTTANTAVLTYLVPAGDYVRLVSTIAGTGTATIISQTEQVLG